jgi:hypothetical protein
MSGWVGPLNSGVAAGNAGAATKNTDSTVVLTGIVRAIYVKYNDSPPAGTTDVTIKTKGTNAPSYNLLVIANGATDGYYQPTLVAHDTAGAGRTYDGTRPVAMPIYIDDIINVKIDQADAADSVDVWLWLED